jgi:uncharacterized protein YjbJ (UPF0337 family)
MGLGDKISNSAEKLSGSAKEAAGKATGDRETQAEGTGEKVKGQAKQAGEKVKETFSDAKDSAAGLASGLKNDNEEGKDS